MDKVKYLISKVGNLIARKIISIAFFLCLDKPDYIRYKTKKRCYRTFISELEIEIHKQKF